MERSLQTAGPLKTAASKFVYVHVNTVKEKEAWNQLSKAIKLDGSVGIPLVCIFKPNGELAHRQSGSKDLTQTLEKYAKELAIAKSSLSNKEAGKLRAANKEAAALLKSGKFVSAFEKLAEFGDKLEDEHKNAKQARETLNEILSAAKERIDTAAAAAVKPLEPTKFDAAYHLTVIARVFADHEDVKSAVDAKIKDLEKDENAGPLLKQAKIFDEAREAEKAEETSKAKELYSKLIADFKNSPGARKAQARLDAMNGGE